MMGFLYVLLCFAAGWALTDRFLPDLRSPALNVHRILGTSTFLGARRHPEAVRAGAALDVAVRPWLLVLVSSYLLGTLAVTWTVYGGATLFRHTEQPLWGGNLVAWGTWGAVAVLQGVSRRRTGFVPAGVGEWLRENRRELILLGVCALGSAALCSLTLFRRGDEIGLGLSVETPSLGNLVNDGRKVMMQAGLRYQLLYPTLILSFVTIAFYLIGNAFSDAADPKNHLQ